MHVTLSATPPAAVPATVLGPTSTSSAQVREYTVFGVGEVGERISNGI
jgi:hypothetical protein